VNTSVLRECASSVSRFEILFLTDQHSFDPDIVGTVSYLYANPVEKAYIYIYIYIYLPSKTNLPLHLSLSTVYHLFCVQFVTDLK
jgi:hypothetical protein